MGAEANRNRKRKRTKDKEVEAVALQDKLDKQFAQDIKAVVAKRERARQEKGKAKVQETSTPAIRNKRTIKKTIRWESNLQYGGNLIYSYSRSPGDSLKSSEV